MQENEAHQLNLIEAAMKHRQVVIILVLLLNLAGIYGLMHMPRKEFPEFTVRQGIVEGIYPGLPRWKWSSSSPRNTKTTCSALPN